MATHDYSIANQTAPNFRTDLNNVLSAIVSQNSNATAPSTTFANMWWYDTTNDILKIRNESNNAWIEVMDLDQTSNIATPSTIASQAEAEAGTNNTKPMTPQATHQAVDAKVKVYRDATGQSFTAPGTIFWTPSLGQRPDWYTLFLEVQETYQGWEAGDRLIWTDTGNTSGGNLATGFWYDDSADRIYWKNALTQWAYWATASGYGYLDASKFKAHLHCGIFA